MTQPAPTELGPPPRPEADRAAIERNFRTCARTARFAADELESLVRRRSFEHPDVIAASKAYDDAFRETYRAALRLRSIPR